MQRIYFLAPDITVAGAIVDDLLLARIPEQDIYIVGKDKSLLERAELPTAGILQESDVIPAIERGITVGGATGLLAGLIAVSVPPAGLAFGGGAILATTLAGAGFGAAVAPMIGISVPNSQLEEYEDAIQRGELLFLVDVNSDRAEAIRNLIRRHHPDVKIMDTEASKQAFP